MNACFISSNYYSMQVLTGHDDFKAKFGSLSLAMDGRCECNMEDTVLHHILDCPVFDF